MKRESSREIVAFLVVFFAAFLGVCIYTQNPLDYLGHAGDGVYNACGRFGALLSYHSTLWIGKAGSYGLVTILGLFGLSLFFRRRVEQPGWKLTGAALMILTLACFEVAVFDVSGDAEVYMGGHYGTFFYDLLFSNLSGFGTYLILLCSAIIAFIIGTDTALYPALARSNGVLLDRERWSRFGTYLRERTPAFPDLRSLGDSLKALTSGSGTKKKKKKKAKTKAKAKQATSTQKAKARAGGRGARKAEKAAPPEASDEELEEEEEDEEEYEYEYVYEDVAEEEEEEEKEEEAEEAEEEEEEEEEEDENDAAVDKHPSGVFTIREPDALLRKAKKATPPPRPIGPYHLPSMDLIKSTPIPENFLDKNALTRTAGKIEKSLHDFKIDAQVVEAQKGPTITQFEVSLAAGIKVHKIVNLSDDLAMALEAQSIRIIAPIPGKSTVGIEVPNDNRSMVGVRELVELMRDNPGKFNLPLALGRDTAGNPVIGDLGEMPHLLIAGSTGSGKSVCINSIIVSIMMTRTPDEVKLILVDPKMVELAQFEKIPHLLCPVVTDMKKAPAVLNWLVDKMDERYELMAMAGVRQISSYNALGREKLNERLQGKLSPDEIESTPECLPFVVVVIDELADLMMTAAKEVEGSITRLSQKSRAVGIHVILATQRPSVDVITGLIKANMPARVSFRVTSRVDSRTILDRNGADKLLGKGDCLYLPPGTSDVMRVQGAFIPDQEIRNVVKCVAREAEPQYNSELTRFGIDGVGDQEEQDALFEDAVQIVLGSQRGSVTLLQRQLQIGYTRASRLMELLSDRGLVGPFQGSKAREVYYTLEEWDKSKGRREAIAEDEGE